MPDVTEPQRRATALQRPLQQNIRLPAHSHPPTVRSHDHIPRRTLRCLSRTRRCRRRARLLSRPRCQTTPPTRPSTMPGPATSHLVATTTRHLTRARDVLRSRECGITDTPRCHRYVFSAVCCRRDAYQSLIDARPLQLLDRWDAICQRFASVGSECKPWAHVTSHALPPAKQDQLDISVTQDGHGYFAGSATCQSLCGATGTAQRTTSGACKCRHSLVLLF